MKNPHIRRALMITVAAAAATIVSAGCSVTTFSDNTIIDPPDPTCPAIAPRHGEACVDESLSCDTTDDCDFDTVAICLDGAWNVEPSGFCDAAQCPIAQPIVGSGCDDLVALTAGPERCSYMADTPCGTQEIVVSCRYDELSISHSWELDVAPTCDSEPVACQTYSDSGLCDADAGCAWRTPGCGEGDPNFDAGCYPEPDCMDAGCGDWGTCTQVTYDPCWNSLCQACGAEGNICVPN